MRSCLVSTHRKRAALAVSQHRWTSDALGLLIYGIPHCTGGERDRCKTPIEVSTPKTKIWTNLKNTEKVNTQMTI